jgi:hypothetical protein
MASRKQPQSFAPAGATRAAAKIISPQPTAVLAVDRSEAVCGWQSVNLAVIIITRRPQRSRRQKKQHEND